MFSLRKAWHGIAAVSPKIMKIKNTVNGDEIAHRADMISVLTFKMSIGEISGMVTFYHSTWTLQRLLPL